ncbi:MAG: toll/interleukin-1 receptor domain-containing protein [Candidatus Methylophosphatis roskildensis]
MRDAPAIHIDGRTYLLNPECNRYQVPLDQLGSLRMADIPPHHHLEVLGVQVPAGEISCELWLVNGGDAGTDQHLSVYGGAWIPVTPDIADRELARLRRAFPNLHPYDGRKNPQFEIADPMDRGLKSSVFLSLSFEGRGETTVREAIAPFVEGFRRLSLPDARVFICHASEDKSVVREIAANLRADGMAIWLDEIEIQVGDSIVQKVSEGLEGASHLIIVLSRNSVAKPWVGRELSYSLMRQLRDRSITILPVRLDDSDPPPLLSDIKYADCRRGLSDGVNALRAAIYGVREQ